MSNDILFTQKQISILNGSMLGDGHLRAIATKTGKSSLIKNQSRKRKEYLNWHLNEFGDLSNALKDRDNFCKGKKYLRTTFTTKASKFLGDMRSKWYPKGKKIVPNDLELDPLTIAIWFCDDGYNNVESRVCTFATYCFSKKDCCYLIKQFKKFGINCYLNKENVIKTRSESYKAFVDLIGPYVIWDCFQYKLAYREPKFKFSTKEQHEKIIAEYKSGMYLEQIGQNNGVSINLVSRVLKKEFNSKDLALNNTSGHKGVSWDKSRNQWAATGKRDGKRFFVRFDKLEDALLARKNWEKGC
jgi:hypothetical protein